MTESLKLAHPPIVEAVVNIYCDLPAGIDFSEVQKRAETALNVSYPAVRRQLAQRQEFRTIAEPSQPETHQQVTGLQFLSEDEKQVVQMRAEGYAFNRLAPYTSLDNYLPHLEWSWNVFREVTRTIQVRAISLRFINRILLPTVQGRVQLDDYLRIGPQLPDETLEFTGLLNRHAAVEVKTGNQVNITLVTQPLEGDRLPMILDIEASALRPQSPEDWPRIREAIGSLRRLKNRVFERTLTEKCLNLFRQP
jgi:uncharacterized protein (TIGR04255 family)